MYPYKYNNMLNDYENKLKSYKTMTDDSLNKNISGFENKIKDLTDRDEIIQLYKSNYKPDNIKDVYNNTPYESMHNTEYESYKKQAKNNEIIITVLNDKSFDYLTKCDDMRNKFVEMIKKSTTNYENKINIIYNKYIDNLPETKSNDVAIQTVGSEVSTDHIPSTHLEEEMEHTPSNYEEVKVDHISPNRNEEEMDHNSLVQEDNNETSVTISPPMLIDCTNMLTDEKLSKDTTDESNISINLYGD